MPKLTLADLKSKGACRPARIWFKKKFPEGTTVAKAIADCPRGSWLCWWIARDSDYTPQQSDMADSRDVSVWFSHLGTMKEIHLACANAIRKLMRTKRWKKAGRGK